MAKLYFNSFLRRGEKVTDRDVVDVLTTNKYRTSVWAPRKEGKIILDIIGLNSVSQGVPIEHVVSGKVYDERGFVNPQDESLLYMIDADEKVIWKMPNKTNLFYDQDKVADNNRFVWDGTFQEFIDEFRKRNYVLQEGVENGS